MNGKGFVALGQFPSHFIKLIFTSINDKFLVNKGTYNAPIIPPPSPNTTPPPNAFSPAVVLKALHSP
jgi:hypothetical protein